MSSVRFAAIKFPESFLRNRIFFFYQFGRFVRMHKVRSFVICKVDRLPSGHDKFDERKYSVNFYWAHGAWTLHMISGINYFWFNGTVHPKSICQRDYRMYLLRNHCCCFAALKAILICIHFCFAIDIDIIIFISIGNRSKHRLPHGR